MLLFLLDCLHSLYSSHVGLFHHSVSFLKEFCYHHLQISSTVITCSAIFFPIILFHLEKSHHFYFYYYFNFHFYFHYLKYQIAPLFSRSPFEAPNGSKKKRSGKEDEDYKDDDEGALTDRIVTFISY